MATSIEQTLIWKEFLSDEQLKPESTVLTYAPAYLVFKQPELVFRVQKSEDVKPDVLMWAYIESPIGIENV